MTEMEQFKFRVTLKVSVPAYDEMDAQEILEEIFGVGEEVGVTVTECKYERMRR